ncbi:response regulator transcription factor [Actinosynnema sp. NPDC047251]|nr:response regulator transcription factor [Saccharothrix espanaensis]
MDEARTGVQAGPAARLADAVHPVTTQAGSPFREGLLTAWQLDRPIGRDNDVCDRDTGRPRDRAATSGRARKKCLTALCGTVFEGSWTSADRPGHSPWRVIVFYADNQMEVYSVPAGVGHFFDQDKNGSFAVREISHMSPNASEQDDESACDLVELLRQAHAHQRAAQQLIARAEELCRQGHAAARNPPPCPGGDVWDRFTERETEVAELLTQGMSNRIIARRLDISERTVKNHLNSIFQKLGVADRTQTVIALMRGT